MKQYFMVKKTNKIGGIIVKEKQRPIGITILSVLSLIGGIGMVGVLMIYGKNLMGVTSIFNISALMIIGSVLFLGLWAIGSGVGMLLGKKWGWWMAGVYYVYAILRYLNVLVTVFSLADDLEATTSSIEYNFVKFSARIAGQIFVLSYLFKDHVREYFDVEQVSKLKAILYLIGIGIAIFAVAFILTSF